ncbi:MAG TPA: hypothetical protein VD978_23765 [Azospirillum sp.]|nr:hypothetical protein [Azospirillum sp.]
MYPACVVDDDDGVHGGVDGAGPSIVERTKEYLVAFVSILSGRRSSAPC